MNKKVKLVKYDNRIVVFMDILGFKKIISDSDTDENKLNVIHKCLRFLKARELPAKWNLKFIQIEEDAQKRGVYLFDISKSAVCTAFSDSIVVSADYTEDNINEVTSTIVANLAFIGAFLISEGILIRGAITIGKLLHKSEGIIMGQALIEAYELESRAAKYPRIILSERLIRKLNYPIETKRNRYPYHQYVDRFSDGCVGFHQMTFFQVNQSWEGMSKSRLKRELKKVKQTIINGLDSTFENADIYEKFVWLRSQYDGLLIFCDGAKEKIFNLNENISGQNIHFSNTDNFHFPKK